MNSITVKDVIAGRKYAVKELADKILRSLLYANRYASRNGLETVPDGYLESYINVEKCNKIFDLFDAVRSAFRDCPTDGFMKQQLHNMVCFMYV